jgi:sigma-B regulation protein RsbU (phosphoserine phosphatase)
MIKRVGEILRAKGYISEGQLEEALQIQAQSRPHKLLGQILMDRGSLTQEQAQLYNYCQECQILDLVARINSTNDLQTLLSLIIEAACEIMKAEGGSSVILRDRKSGDLIISVPTGPASKEISGIHIPAGQGICGWVVEHGKPQVISDASKDPHFYKKVDKLTGFPTRDVICVPLRTPQGKIIGALEAVNRRGGRAFTQADVPLFSVFADQAAIALERSRLQKEALEKRLLEHELGLAYQVQKGFWPKRLPSYPGISVAAMNLPALHAGGDYYDFIQTNGDGCTVVIGDVSGKGISAALLMATLRAMLRAQLENRHSMEETISLVNNTLVKDSASNKFVTLFCGVLDVAKRDFTYVNAGHNPPMLYDRTTGETKNLEAGGGPVLGFMEDRKFEAAKEKLRPGQVLALFTDGVVEAQNSAEEFFGEERLRRTISDHADENAQLLMDRIYQAVKDFVGESPQFDDLTLIIVKVEDSGK